MKHNPRYYINALPFLAHTAESFASHLRSIVNHTARLAYKRKKEAKARAAKPPAPAWSLTRNKKGTLVLTIRKRKPPYLYAHEWRDITKAWAGPGELEEIRAIIARRKILIKPDPKNGAKT